MPLELDPARVHPNRGYLLVEITEKLGGLTKGGIFIPGSIADTDRKDTAMGRILELGPPPELCTRKKVRGERSDPWVPNPGVAWPDDYEPFVVGHYVIFPRDVPLAFFWKEARYALVYRHECFLHFADPEAVEFLARES